MKKLAIIGASDLQLPLILKAKQMGLETHVFAWKTGAPGETAADYFYPISIIEIDSIIKECKRIQPNGIATIASDLAAITVIKTASALGLPCNPLETATIATNKYEMRKALLQAGLPTPHFYRIDSNLNNLEDAKKLDFPVIVKPTDRSGSRGIFKVHNPNDLQEAVLSAFQESFEKCAIVEEYIEGDEFSCECITVNGIHNMLSITKKYTTGAPHFIEIGHIEPSGLDDKTCERVKTQVFCALDALHVRAGASHSEFRVNKDGEIRLIEIGARMGGDCIGSDLVHLSTGYDFVRMVIECAIGEPVTLKKGLPRGVAAVRYIMNREDYEFLQKNQPNLGDHFIRKSDICYPENTNVTDSSTRNGFYVIIADSIEEAKHLANLDELA